MNDLSFKKSLFYFSIALLLLELIVYKDFIFGNYYFVYKDLGDDYYTYGFPELYAQVESFKHGQIPQWDFHTNLGENKYPRWLEPITIGIAFLFFKNDVVASLIWIQLTYIFLAGVLLFCFFRNSKFHYLPSAIGAILYVFSGYVVGCSSWYLEFSQEAMLLALILFATQLFINKKARWLLPISVAIIGISTSVILFYIAFLVVLVYLILNTDILFKVKQTLNNVLSLILAALIGLGLASFVVWSNLHQLLQSPRGTGMYPIQDTLKNSPIQWIDKNEFSTSILRFFSNNMQGVADNFKGWYNYFEAPFWYCGLITLVLIPQLFHFLNRKNKIIYGSILGFFFLLVTVPYFRIAFWLFSGNYYRMLGTFVAIFLLYFAIQALHFFIVKKVIYVKTLIVTVIGCIVLLFSQRDFISNDASPNVGLISFVLIAYAVLLFLFNKQSFKNYVPYVLLGMVCLEAISFSNTTLTERKITTTEHFKKGNGYNDITKVIVADLKKTDTSFYRVEKDYYSGVSRSISYNEAFVQDFYGSSGYCAFHNANYIKFLESINALYMEGEIGSRFVKGIREIPEAMQICGVKYFISNQDSILKYQTNFDLIKEINGHKVYQLKNNLPFGFTYSRYITENDFDKLAIQQKRTLLNKTIVVDVEFAKKLKSLKAYNANDNIQIEHSFLKMVSFQNNEIKGTIEVKQPEILFFSIPFDEGWTIHINGKITEKRKVFHGLTGIYLPNGNHTIELNYEPPYRKTGTIISIISLFVLVLIIILNKKISEIFFRK